MIYARGRTFRNPWRARLSGHLEADGFQTRLAGRSGMGAPRKAAVVGWTALMLLVWLAGVASRSVEQAAANTAYSMLGLSIVHGFVVAAGRSRPGEIAYLRFWLADRLA